MLGKILNNAWFYVWNYKYDILGHINCLFVKRIESFLALDVYGDIRGTWIWKWDIKANAKAMKLSHHETPIKVLDFLYEPLYHFPSSLNFSFSLNFTLFLKLKREMKESQSITYSVSSFHKKNGIDEEGHFDKIHWILASLPLLSQPVWLVNYYSCGPVPTNHHIQFFTNEGCLNLQFR